MALNVSQVDLYVQDAKMRMPFHFGNVQVYDCPRILIDVEVDFGRRSSERGRSMGAIVPMWFLKRPDMTFSEGISELLAVIRSACNIAKDLPEQNTTFDFWYELSGRQAEWGSTTPHPPLLSQYGTSLVEQAVIDAHCRMKSQSFATAIRENTLGINLGVIHSELAGEDPMTYLPEKPLRKVAVRHTVGLTDPLTEADISSAQRADDGLPQSLESCIQVYGIDHFKIKIGADVESDRERLLSIASLIRQYHDDFVFTLDANEQYGNISTFKQQWETLAADPELAEFLDHLLYVEQPLDRSNAFGSETRSELMEWTDHPPMIIDESDAAINSLSRALDNGYNGTSHKNCKGVFKGIANRCLLEHLQRSGEREYRMSAEDLTTIGPIEVQQDLAVVASLGIEHVERNGHHYLRGLSMYDQSMQEAVLHAHSDLYRRHEDGYPTLDITNGEIRIGSIVDSPFGYNIDVEESSFTPLEDWSPN